MYTSSPSPRSQQQQLHAGLLGRVPVPIVGQRLPIKQPEASPFSTNNNSNNRSVADQFDDADDSSEQGDDRLHNAAAMTGSTNNSTSNSNPLEWLAAACTKQDPPAAGGAVAQQEEGKSRDSSSSSSPKTTTGTSQGKDDPTAAITNTSVPALSPPPSRLQRRFSAGTSDATSALLEFAQAAGCTGKEVAQDKENEVEPTATRKQMSLDNQQLQDQQQSLMVHQGYAKDNAEEEKRFEDVEEEEEEEEDDEMQEEDDEEEDSNMSLLQVWNNANEPKTFEMRLEQIRAYRAKQQARMHNDLPHQPWERDLVAWLAECRKLFRTGVLHPEKAKWLHDLGCDGFDANNFGREGEELPHLGNVNNNNNTNMTSMMRELQQQHQERAIQALLWRRQQEGAVRMAQLRAAGLMPPGATDDVTSMTEHQQRMMMMMMGAGGGLTGARPTALPTSNALQEMYHRREALAQEQRLAAAMAANGIPYNRALASATAPSSFYSPSSRVMSLLQPLDSLESRRSSLAAGGPVDPSSLYEYGSGVGGDPRAHALLQAQLAQQQQQQRRDSESTYTHQERRPSDHSGYSATAAAPGGTRMMVDSRRSSDVSGDHHDYGTSEHHDYRINNEEEHNADNANSNNEVDPNGERTPRTRKSWAERMKEMRCFFLTYGHIQVLTRGQHRDLGRWLSCVRCKIRHGSLPENQLQDILGMRSWKLDQQSAVEARQLGLPSRAKVFSAPADEVVERDDYAHTAAPVVDGGRATTKTAGNVDLGLSEELLAAVAASASIHQDNNKDTPTPTAAAAEEEGARDEKESSSPNDDSQTQQKPPKTSSSSASTKPRRAVPKSWNQSFEELLQFKDKFGHCDVKMIVNSPYNLLGKWLASQRSRHKLGQLPAEKVNRLRDLGCCGFGGDDNNLPTSNYDKRTPTRGNGIAHKQELAYAAEAEQEPRLTYRQERPAPPGFVAAHGLMARSDNGRNGAPDAPEDPNEEVCSPLIRRDSRDAAQRKKARIDQEDFIRNRSDSMYDDDEDDDDDDVEPYVRSKYREDDEEAEFDAAIQRLKALETRRGINTRSIASSASSTPSNSTPSSPSGGRREKRVRHSFEARVEHVLEFKAKHGHCKVRLGGEDKHEELLARWLASARSRYRAGQFRENRAAELRAVGCEGFEPLGFSPTTANRDADAEDGTERSTCSGKKRDTPTRTATPSPVPPRDDYDYEGEEGDSPTRKKQRTSLEGTKRQSFDDMLQELESYQYVYGVGCSVPKPDGDGGKLGRWLAFQRRQFLAGKLATDRIEKLRVIGRKEFAAADLLVRAAERAAATAFDDQ